MADIIEGNRKLKKRFKDMGDGTFAEVVYEGGAAAGAASAPKVSVSTTRPADTVPYDAHDAIANAFAAGNIVQMFFSTAGLGPVITKIRVKKSNAAVPAKIRVHFFDAVVTSTAGDNVPYTQSAVNSLGSVVVDVSEIGTDNTIGVADVNIPIGTATVIYVKLEAEEGFTPASAEAFTVSVWTGLGGGGDSSLLAVVENLKALDTTRNADIATIKTDMAATRVAAESPLPVRTIGHATPFRFIHTALAADGAKTDYKLLDCPTGSRIVITQCGAKLSPDVSVVVNCRVGLAIATLPAAALTGVAGMCLSGKYSVASMIGEKNIGAPTLAFGTDDQDLRGTWDAPTGGDLRIEYSGYFETP